MNDMPRRQIMALIDKYGPDALDMSRTVESELHLACPGASAEVDGLVAALRHGVVHYFLYLAEAGKFETSDLPAQVLRLRAEAGLEEIEAPWYIIPSDCKWFRNLASARIVVQRLELLGLRPPAVSVDLDAIRGEYARAAANGE
jgi:hypothetical protein